MDRKEVVCLYPLVFLIGLRNIMYGKLSDNDYLYLFILQVFSALYFFSLLYNFCPNFITYYVSPPCIVIFSFIYCSSTLSGEHIHCQEICTYKILCKFRQESIYISPGLSIQSLFTYICVLSLYL